VRNKSKRRKEVVRYYWRFDIDNLCIAQKGYSLAILRKIWADEIARKEAEEKPRPGWRRQCRDTVKAGLSGSVWKVWTEDANYTFARGTYATDLTKETLQQWFGLTADHQVTDSPSFLKNAFVYATTKAAYALMDQAWIDDMVAQLLTHMKWIADYSMMAYTWHKTRIMEELERKQRVDVIKSRSVCHLCGGNFRPPGVSGFLVHMRILHEEFWADGSWTIV
jgi:hypothetical protein